MTDDAPEITARTDIMMKVARELGEHRKGIAVLESTWREATREMREVTRAINGVVTKGECEDKHVSLSNNLQGQFKSGIARIEKAVDSGTRVKHGFWPRDFNGIIKMIGTILLLIGFLIGVGWSAANLFLGDGIEVTAVAPDGEGITGERVGDRKLKEIMKEAIREMSGDLGP